eukprot:366430-Chlamydomonas_euryale.AAC.7
MVSSLTSTAPDFERPPCAFLAAPAPAAAVPPTLSLSQRSTRPLTPPPPRRGFALASSFAAAPASVLPPLPFAWSPPGRPSSPLSGCPAAHAASAALPARCGCVGSPSSPPRPPSSSAASKAAGSRVGPRCFDACTPAAAPAGVRTCWR